jgi:outer membrane receptor protein involved in Fe transport
MNRNELAKSVMVMLLVGGALPAVALPEEPDSIDGDYDTTLLDEIVVARKRPVIESNGEKVGYYVEDDPESTSKSVLEMLRKVPMVTVDAQDNILINGKSDFKIYVNGKEDPMLSSNPSNILKSMPAGNIRKIEVILEPGAKYDAEGVGGILNIITVGKKLLDGYLTTLTAGINNRNLQGSVYACTKFNKVTQSVNFGYYNNNFSPTKSWGVFDRKYLSVGDDARLMQDMSQRQSTSFYNGSYQMSWEPDTLNLFTLNVSGMGADFSGDVRTESKYLASGSNVWRNVQNLANSGIWGSINVNAGFQHNFDNKGQSIIFSYQYNHGWNNNDIWQEYVEMENYTPYAVYQYNYNNNPTNEHTFQIDYSKPLSFLSTLELGGKGILRRNYGKGYNKIGEDESRLTQDENNNVDMSQYQDVGAIYAAYSARWGGWNAKVGARYEYTYMGVDFNVGGYDNFSSHLNDFVPNVAVAYNLNLLRTLRASYQTRIRRPGVDELNPHVTSILSDYVQQGNPDLTSEKTHNFAITYSDFGGKLNSNIRLEYSVSNNSISSSTKLIDNVITQTYDNLGVEKGVTLNVYESYRFNNKLSANVNASAAYQYFNFKEQNMKNHGWVYNLHAGVNYSMPWKLQLSAYGGFNTKRYDLEGYNSGFNYYGLSLGKTLLKGDRLKLSISANNFLTSKNNYSSYSHNVGFEMRHSLNVKTWSVGMSVSYTLGNMSNGVRHTATSIENDDVETKQQKQQ